jgi:hypothetical protein
MLLTVMPFSVEAQRSRCPPNNAAVDPLVLQHVFAIGTSQRNTVIADSLAFRPVIPLGPQDILKRYEDDMSLVTNRFSAEMGNISQAVVAGQITREQAEYAIQQSYDFALIQHEVLTALHDSLEHDVDQQAIQGRDASSQSDSIVVQPPLTPQLQGH